MKGFDPLQMLTSVDAQYDMIVGFIVLMKIIHNLIWLIPCISTLLSCEMFLSDSFMVCDFMCNEFKLKQTLSQFG